ncbi:MAG: hypothetical protein Hyperionvirus2_6 [Hyperionvirus sp.]|uniref:Uncharacterized protein n=1 Tax=Hyperionvirus sp. TaxID=2487770 RepID=A0A3G5A633_9VIRU|nr:MAG: hypothetical protein Hyperionvirus2_6 [Hyperionvirus sp.]
MSSNFDRLVFWILPRPNIMTERTLPDVDLFRMASISDSRASVENFVVALVSGLVNMCCGVYI